MNPSGAPSVAADPAQPAIPLVVWSIVAVILLAVAWVVAERIREDTVEATVAVNDMSAYHRITEDDLKSAETSTDESPQGALASAALQGRVTREAISAGQAIGPTSVTSVVDPGDLSGVRLDLSPARASVSGVQAGDQVVLRLAPTSDDASLEPVEVPGLLLNAGEDDKPPFTVIVRANQVTALLRLVGRSELFLTAPG